MKHFHVESLPCWICPPVDIPDDLPEKKRQNKVIIKLDRQGKMIDTYPSVQDAAAAHKVSNASISRALKGVRPTAANFKWEYA